MARIEFRNHIRFAEKLSEPQTSADDFKKESVSHFYTQVLTGSGEVLRFDDAGSRALKIKSDWKIRETKKPQT